MGRQTVRGAKAVGSGFARFFAGAGFVFRGSALFVTTPALWALVVVPVLLTVLALFGLHEATAALVDRLSAWLLSFVDFLPGWVLWLLAKLLWLAAAVLFHLAMTALTVPLTMLFGAAFFPFITRGVLRRTTGPGAVPAPAPRWHRAAGVCLRQAVIIAVVLQLGWLIVLPLMWIPGVNLAAALGFGLLFNGFLTGLLVLAVPLHHHGVRGPAEQLRFAWRHLAFTLGFGVTSLLALMLPVLLLRVAALLPFTPLAVMPGAVLYLLTAPSVLVGAVLLHGRMTARPPAAAWLDVRRG